MKLLRIPRLPQPLKDQYFRIEASLDYVDLRTFHIVLRKRLPPLLPDLKSVAADQGMDWRLLTAMAYQESHWDPLATSPTGVRGLMMLTLPTAHELAIDDRLDPRQSLEGGARYLTTLRRRLPSRIQEPDRTWLALAAYNLGFGHLEDARIMAQRAGSNPDAWSEVREHLPRLRQKRWHRTTKHGYARGSEAVEYVENVRRYYGLVLELDNSGALRRLEHQAAADTTRTERES